MTIEEALKGHNHIKVQLMLFLNDTGKLDTPTACHNENCALGLWLYKALKKVPECVFLNKLATTHAAFHHCAAEIVTLSKQGRKQEAIKIANTDHKLKYLSTKMTDLVKNYQKQHQTITNI